MRVLKWIGFGLMGLITLIVIALMGLGFAVTTGVVPATVVQNGDELPQKQLEALREANILERNELVKFYYLEGLLDPTYGGSILTDKRLIGFWTDEVGDGQESVQVFALPVEILNGIEMTEAGDYITDAVYEVSSTDEDLGGVILYLSVEEDRHLEMTKAIETQISKNLAAAGSTDETPRPGQ